MYLLSKLNTFDIFLLNFDGKLLKEAINIYAIAHMFCCLQNICPFLLLVWL